jgi:hypothetical protein
VHLFKINQQIKKMHAHCDGNKDNTDIVEEDEEEMNNINKILSGFDEDRQQFQLL